MDIDQLARGVLETVQILFFMVFEPAIDSSIHIRQLTV